MEKLSHRIEKHSGQSLRNWEKLSTPKTRTMKKDAFVEMGWGRLVFGHTFGDPEQIVEAMCTRGYDQRDISMYVIDPHVLVSMAPDKLFLDPSHTYRLRCFDFPGDSQTSAPGISIKRLSREDEAEAVNAIYAKCRMKGADPEFLLDKHATRVRTYFVARRNSDGKIVGTVSGVDHVAAFDDPENGASIWSLAVDPQGGIPGTGTRLVRHILAHYFTRGREFVDVSVMHDNNAAIHLYEKLKFTRIPAFCVKRKNAINAPLYVPPSAPLKELNPYARLIADEAGQRGIITDVIDAESGLLKLSHGSRSITCRESLSELTSAVSMAACDDKRLTRKLVKDAGISVPRQIRHATLDQSRKFMEAVDQVVVKPARGEQGQGISVDISEPDELENALEEAQKTCSDVLVEEYVKGEDVRVIVIDHEVVAAAVRKPPVLTGTGTHTVRELISRHNQRRMAATGGESRIPEDNETLRCLLKQGVDYDTVPAQGQRIQARKTANLHTGGTIHDITAPMSGALKKASVTVSRALDIPVTGLDFMVPDIRGSEYAFIEANERPGLANHEPQPTAERFIDLLFPETA